MDVEFDYSSFRRDPERVKLRVDPSTLDTERENLERLLSERFNFFLVWVALICTAAALFSERDHEMRAATMGFGTVVSVLLAAVLYRTKEKLRWTLAVLRAANPEHGAAINNRPPSLEWWPESLSILRLIGLIIPLVCTVGLLVGALIFMTSPREEPKNQSQNQTASALP